jgi:hypothetical protein
MVITLVDLSNTGLSLNKLNRLTLNVQFTPIQCLFCSPCKWNLTLKLCNMVANIVTYVRK